MSASSDMIVEKVTHTRTNKHTNKKQMLSPPRCLTSTLMSGVELSPLLLETGPPCAMWRLRAMATVHLELGQSHPGALTMAQLWTGHQGPQVCCMMLLPSQQSCPPQSMTRYSFILLSREKQLCVSFLLKEIMP